MKILVVDDDEWLRQSICKLLDKLGHTTVEAKDGREAIDCFDTILDSNAVITDIQMPRGNGIDVLQTMWRKRKMIPTYVHSATQTFTWHDDVLDLPIHIPHTFDFASFKLKDGQMMNNIRGFVESITPKK